MSVHISLIGRPAIRDESGERRRIRGHKPWALLARILLTGRELSRQQLAAELFPDAEDPLGSLRWSLAELRRAVGCATSFTGDPVRANLPEGAEVDLDSLLAGEVDQLDAHANLLDGVDPRCGPEFESWLLVERERTAALIDAQCRQALLRATSLGHHARAMRLGQLAVSRRPYDEGVHILLVKAMAAAGSPAAAQRHVVATTELFRRELGTEPSPALASAGRAAIADPAPGVPAGVVAATTLDAGLAALAAGAVEAGMECLRRATAEAERAGDRRLQAVTLLELGSALVHSVRGYDDEGAVLLRQAADLGVDAADPLVAARALRELAYTDALAGRRQTAMAYLDESAALAAGDADALAGVEGVRGFNTSEWGRLDEGVEHYQQSIDLARSASNARREAWSLGLGARTQLLAGRQDEAGAWLSACLELVGREQWAAFRPWPAALVGELQLALGADPGAVRADLEPTFAMSCQLGDPCWEGASARVIALSHAASGELEPALAWIAEARTRCSRETDSYAGMQASILATEAQLSHRAGDAVRAEAAARALLTLAARTNQDGFVDQALSLIGLVQSTSPGSSRWAAAE